MCCRCNMRKELSRGSQPPRPEARVIIETKSTQNLLNQWNNALFCTLMLFISLQNGNEFVSEGVFY